jgi:hypothetical protein
MRACVHTQCMYTSLSPLSLSRPHPPHLPPSPLSFSRLRAHALPLYVCITLYVYQVLELFKTAFTRGLTFQVGTSVSAYICIHTYIHVYVHVCVCVCARACLCLCLCLSRTLARSSLPSSRSLCVCVYGEKAVLICMCSTHVNVLCWRLMCMCCVGVCTHVCVLCWCV